MYRTFYIYDKKSINLMITLLIIGRILGYGSVKVTGMGNSFVMLSKISNPLRVKITIENQLY